ncbi:protein of unknown function [Candidatus Promineifilum breve]|uniref:Uncharacterized protein n=1 Tax=Candidatus Promineifilum breve TaxID=1806508 RepID=A0A160T6X0_9CHLR|nr:protein of unknown function [Candidatus Promineifilum breve]
MRFIIGERSVFSELEDNTESTEEHRVTQRESISLCPALWPSLFLCDLCVTSYWKDDTESTKENTTFGPWFAPPRRLQYPLIRPVAPSDSLCKPAY